VGVEGEHMKTWLEKLQKQPYLLLVLVVILSVLFLREKMVKIQYVGVLVSFIGVIWIFTKGQLESIFTLSFNTGDLFVLLAVINWSVYAILMKKRGIELPKKATFLSTIALGILILTGVILASNPQYLRTLLKKRVMRSNV
jgi:drug/metabolite transporter (DMT)-like permease